MLDQSYFNGDRERRFLQLVEKTASLLALKRRADAKIDMSMVDLPNYYMDQVDKTYGTDYLIPFYPKAKLIRSVPGVSVTYEVPGNFERDADYLEIDRSNITLNYDVICSVTRGIWETIPIDLDCGSFPSDGFVPPPYYGDKHSGQMKIVTDVVLSVDDMIARESKNNYKILVIGSSSPGGVRAGSAYTLIPYMCAAEVDMYDPYEVYRKYSFFGEYQVNYNVRGKAFDYAVLQRDHKSFKQYDLILDDSWVKGMSRNDRDPDDGVLSAPNFSIKQFPWERGRPGNIYFQKFFTSGLEERRVSRNPKEFSRSDNNQLGKCALCRELRLRLLRKYPRSFSEAIMGVHVENCLSGAKQPLDVVASFDGWIKVAPFLVDYDNYCSMNYDFFPGTKMVGSSFQGSESVRFIFSQLDQVPSRILVNSMQVLVCLINGDFFVNRLISEIPFANVPVKQIEGTMNLSHSLGLRDKLGEGQLCAQCDKPVDKVVEDAGRKFHAECLEKYLNSRQGEVNKFEEIKRERNNLGRGKIVVRGDRVILNSTAKKKAKEKEWNNKRRNVSNRKKK